MSEAEQILREHRIEKLPVVDKDGLLVGLITYRDIIKLSEFPNSCKDEFGRLRVAAAVGVTADTHERVAALVEERLHLAEGHQRGRHRAVGGGHRRSEWRLDIEATDAAGDQPQGGHAVGVGIAANADDAPRRGRTGIGSERGNPRS